MATIAPYGEEHSPSTINVARARGEEVSVGQPTIVALYVRKTHRRKDYGRLIMEATIRRSMERGFSKIRVDVLSKYAMRIVNSLPAELYAVLDVYDMSAMDIMDLFPESS